MEWSYEEFYDSLDSMFEQILEHREEDFCGQKNTIQLLNR